MNRRHLFLLFALSAFFIPANSQIPGETYAIVVGISKYRYIKPLTYADNDAELFAELLKSGAAGPVNPENIFLLKNDSANAGNFWSVLQRVMNKKMNKGDRIYIYFAGHGDAVKGLNEYYLLLTDCQAGNDGNNYHLSLGAIDMYHLKNRIGLLTKQGIEVILVLDACRTNELAGGYASQVFSNSILQTKVGEIAMLATGPGQVSIEDASFGSGHGLFTYNLVDALSGRADNEGGNNDSLITLHEVDEWVTRSVSSMSEKFRVKQNPVFSAEDKNKVTIGLLNTHFHSAWNRMKSLQQPYINTAKSSGQRNYSTTTDSTLISLYNLFNDARKQNRLWGDQSADSYFDRMKTRFPNDAITEEAKYQLASDFINFAQQKINLYLEGQDAISVERLAEKNDSVGASGFLSDEYEKIQRTILEKWTIAGWMVEKAARLLSSPNDSTLYIQMKPRINFLLARGFIAKEKESPLKFKEALQYSLESYKADSSAAYIAEGLGLLYAYRHSLNFTMGIDPEYELGIFRKKADTAMRYFGKAIQLAPKWVNPYRGVALKIYGEWQPEKALPYLHYAIRLNPEDATSYILVGDMYRQVKRDSALIYYRKALTLASRTGHSLIYRKMARVYLYGSHMRNSGLFQPDSVLFYSTLAIEAAYGSNATAEQRSAVLKDIYMNIATAYEMISPQQALKYYYKVTDIQPEHITANNAIIGFHKRFSNPDSVKFYSHRFLNQMPNNKFALLSLANLYDNKLKQPDSAIYYYKLHLTVPDMHDMSNERLGYLLMKKDKNDPKPLEYFMDNTKLFPSGWRPYYNIACYFANKGAEEKAIENLEKAIKLGLKNKKQILEEPFFKPLLNHPKFIALLNGLNN